MIGMPGRQAGHTSHHSHQQRVQRRVCILKGNASVPPGEPPEIGPVVECEPAHGDMGSLNGSHLVHEVCCEQFPDNPNIQQEKYEDKKCCLPPRLANLGGAKLMWRPHEQ